MSSDGVKYEIVPSHCNNCLDIRNHDLIAMEKRRMDAEGYPGVYWEPDPQEQRGLVCPKCGCGHLHVIYTRRAWGGAVRRRRECRHCGKRITTTERMNG